MLQEKVQTPPMSIVLRAQDSAVQSNVTIGLWVATKLLGGVQCLVELFNLQADLLQHAACCGNATGCSPRPLIHESGVLLDEAIDLARLLRCLGSEGALAGNIVGMHILAVQLRHGLHRGFLLWAVLWGRRHGSQWSLSGVPNCTYLHQLGLWLVAKGREGLQAVRELRGLEEGQLAVQCLCKAVQCALAGVVLCSLEPMQREHHALWSHGRC